MTEVKKKIGLKRKIGVKKAAPVAEAAVEEVEEVVEAAVEEVEEVVEAEEALTEQSDDAPVDDGEDEQAEEEVVEEEVEAPVVAKKKVIAKSKTPAKAAVKAKTAPAKPAAKAKTGPAVAAAKKIVLGSKRKAVTKVVEEGDRIPHDVLYRRFHEFLGSPDVDLQPETLKQSTDLFKAFEVFMSQDIIPHHPVKFMGEMVRHRMKASRVYCPPTTSIATLIPAHFVALWNMEIVEAVGEIGEEVRRISGKKDDDGNFIVGDWSEDKKTFTPSKDKALIAEVKELIDNI